MRVRRGREKWAFTALGVLRAGLISFIPFAGKIRMALIMPDLADGLGWPLRIGQDDAVASSQTFNSTLLLEARDHFYYHSMLISCR